MVILSAAEECGYYRTWKNVKQPFNNYSSY